MWSLYSRKFLSSLWSSLWGTFWILLSTTLVSVAVGVVLLRLALPGVEHFKPDLEQWVSEEVGGTVEIGDIYVSMEGRFLQLHADQVLVREPESGQPLLSFARGALQFDLLRSLRRGEPVTTLFTLTRPKVVITRSAEGHFLVGGVGAGELEEKEDRYPPLLLGWLLKQPRLKIEDAELLLHEQQLAALQWHLTDVNLDLLNSGYRHQANARLLLDGQQPLEMELEWFGDLLNPQGWDAQMHLKGEGMQLTSLIGGANNPLTPLAQGEANLDVWGEWLSGRLEKGRGLVRRSEQYLDLPGLAAGEFFWKKQGPQAWKLQLEQLVWGGEQASEQDSHPSSAVVVRKQSAQGKDLLLGAVDHIRLVSSPELSGLYATIAHGEGGVLVSGDLHHLQFRSFPNDAGLFNEVEAKMELRQLSAQGTNQLSRYGLSGVNGVLHLNEQQGYFLPASGPLLLGTGEIYPAPIELGLQKGVIHWSKRPNGLLVTLERAEGEVGGLEISGGVQLFSPAAGGAPLLSMALGLEAQRVTDVVKLLPESQLGPELMQWLQQALLSGSLKQGTVSMKGPLDQRFPYQQGEGVFDINLQLEDLYLQYDPEWPTITHSQAQVNFNSDKLHIVLKRGKLDGQAFELVEANGFTLGEQPLMIHGVLGSDSHKLLRTLERTPLKSVATEINSALDLQGYALLDLNPEIPLGEGEEKVRGQVGLYDNQMTVRDIDLTLSQLRGNIDFTEEGVTIEAMQGEALGGLIHLTAFSAEREQRQQVIVNMEGVFEEASMKSWLGLSAHQRKLFSADTPVAWNGRLTVDEDDLQLHLHSRLKGVALETPAPLNKRFDQEWPTTLTLGMNREGVNQLQISTPDRLFAELKKVQWGDDQTQAWRGQVRFGAVEQEVAAETLRRGVTLQGVFEQINLDAWYGLWKEQLGQEKGAIASTLKVDQILLLANEAELFEQQLKNLSLVMQSDESGQWGIGVSSDQVEGKILVPSSVEETLVVNLNYLQLGDEGEARDSSEMVVDQGPEVDPSQFPAMRVSSEKTVINGIDFGVLSLQTHPTQRGLFVDEASLNSDAMRASLQGSWLQRSGQPLSSFNIHVTGDQLGPILGQFGYSGAIDRGKSVIQLKAEWPDTPLDFSLSKLEGALEISVEKGQLQDVDQGVGRVFGLLGIHTLVRRLTLDFSDITDKGFAFDTIGGTFELKQGHAHTRNLVIDGPSATIKVEGRTGIVDQDYDQEVSVSPKISETLPATGALVGGPAGAAVGAALLLYQKLFQEEGLATTRYRLQGSWEEPRLEEIKARAPVSEPTLD